LQHICCVFEISAYNDVIETKQPLIRIGILDIEKQTQIEQALSANSQFTIEKNGDSLAVTNEDGIDAFLYFGAQQITVISPLFPASDIAEKERAKLNETILKTHMVSPLTSMAINTINGEDYYVAFGALSVDSKLDVVIEEVDVLFANVPDLLEAYWFKEQ
jgi:uncharacterized protein YjfI (DUF2170 family)